MNIEWINIESVSKELTDSFDSGDYTFNLFLKEKARIWQNTGESVTYIFADKEEIENNNITRVLGYVSINATGLLYRKGDANMYLSCAEIRMFAIDRRLRKAGDTTRKYSEQIFNLLLANLYYLATHEIGFKAIFLNANDTGKDLYLRNGFADITEFIPPDEEDKIGLEGTTPLLLMINDDFMDIVFAGDI